MAYKDFLAIRARSDGKHDFGAEWNQNINKTISEYNSSLPIDDTKLGINSTYDEKDCLTTIRAFQSSDIFKQSDVDKPENITISRPNGSTYAYKRTMVRVDANLFSDVAYNPLSEPTGRVENNSVLIIDFAMHKFIEKIKTGPYYPNRIVYYAMTPEVLNDPASKPKLVSTQYSKTNGVNFIPCLEIEKKHQYPPTINDNDTPSIMKKQMFFSKFTFELSPIKFKTNPTMTYEKISGEISVTEPGNKTLTFENTISRNEHSPTEILARIRKFFGKKTPNDLFEINGGLHRKRAGDWLQALCCFDIYNRNFKKFIQKQLSGDKITFNKNTHNVYFVTHDQIACAYALSLGANVIFFGPPSLYEKQSLLSTSLAKEYIFLFQNRETRSIYSDIVSVGGGDYNIMQGGNNDPFTNEPHRQLLTIITQIKNNEPESTDKKNIFTPFLTKMNKLYDNPSDPPPLAKVIFYLYLLNNTNSRLGRITKALEISNIDINNTEMSNPEKKEFFSDINEKYIFLLDFFSTPDNYTDFNKITGLIDIIKTFTQFNNLTIFDLLIQIYGFGDPILFYIFNAYALTKIEKQTESKTRDVKNPDKKKEEINGYIQETLPLVQNFISFLQTKFKEKIFRNIRLLERTNTFSNLIDLIYEFEKEVEINFYPLLVNTCVNVEELTELWTTAKEKKMEDLEEEGEKNKEEKKRKRKRKIKINRLLQHRIK